MKRPHAPHVKAPHLPWDERYAFTRLGGIAWAGLATTIYVSVGVVVDRSAGLAPIAFLLVGLFVSLTAMTYTELTGLRDKAGRRLSDTPGASGFARLGFDELVSFVAGWAVVLDLLLLTAIGAEAFSGYILAFVDVSSQTTIGAVLAIGAIVAVGVRNARGPNLAKGLIVRVLLALDALALGFLAIALMIEAVHDGLPLIEFTGGIGLGDVVFAATIGVVAVTGFETAATLVGETPLPRNKRTRFLVGLSLGSMAALVLAGILGGAHRAELADPEHLEAPVAWLAAALEPAWLADGTRVVIALLAASTLAVGTNGAMLAVARLSSNLATSRQIPSKIGRLSPKYGTPTTVIVMVVILTSVLVASLDLQTLIGLYAFGALLALTILQASVIRLRFTMPEAQRRFSIPWSIRLRGGAVPIPAVLGLLLAGGGWIAVLVLHERSGLVGAIWMIGGIALYVGHRQASHLPMRQSVVVPKTVLSRDTEHGEFGSILVPVFGRPLDDDIVQTAGRLARDRALDVEESGGAQIEAIWVFEIPMSLPIASAVDDDRLKLARKALARAKAVGEEYEGVLVATATVRTRRAGAGICDEAKRRGVEVIVMAAEEPSRVRGGSMLGGTGDFSGRALGPITTYVITHAPCRVLLTAPPIDDRGVSAVEEPAPDEPKRAAKPPGAAKP
ncbi:MAG: amino acid permease [Solirubrobacteraceae bacterium]|nr:amino acid permease [Solirubrobacteraceae bacterium]